MINITYTCDKCKESVGKDKVKIVIISCLNHEGNCVHGGEIQLCPKCWEGFIAINKLTIHTEVSPND